MLLQYFHIMFLPHDGIYFLKCTSRSWRKTPPEHDAATPVLHSWDGVLRLAGFRFFSPNVTMVIWSNSSALAVWWLDIPMLFILACNCLNRWMWHLQASGNCSQGWNKCGGPQFSFWYFGWFLLMMMMMSHKEGVCLRCALKYSHRCASNWLKCCQSTYEKLPQPWHHHLGFPKSFKDIAVLLYVNFWLWLKYNKKILSVSLFWHLTNRNNFGNPYWPKMWNAWVWYTWYNIPFNIYRYERQWKY